MTTKSKWASEVAAIADLNEEELQGAMAVEKTGLARPSILVRMHQRFCELRKTREREQLLS